MSTEGKDTLSASQVEEAASEWLIRRDSPSWSNDDQRQFDEWLGASSLHRVAYLRLEAAWEDAARLKALGAGIPGDEPPPRGQWNLGPHFNPPPAEGPRNSAEEGAPVQMRRPASGRRTLVRLSLAATVLLMVGTTLYVLVVGRGDDYRTAVGRIETVALADGSRVTLNTDSEIRVQVTAGERDVELMHGEAFFEVAKDARRPFVVTAGGKRVIAVGTQFSVRQEPAGVEVVVTEGRVRVEEGGVSSGGEPSQEVLTPGTIAHAGTAGVLVQRESVAQAEVRLAWRSGILMFRDQTLAEAVAEFNRYNERQIVIVDPSVAALRIEGNFRATNVDAFVRLLESGFPVHASSEGERIVLSAADANPNIK